MAENVTGLIQGVRNWLELTGYPLEQQAEAAFARAGFDVRRGVHYRDTDDKGLEKRREIDVVASASSRLEVPVWNTEIDITINFPIECKHTPEDEREAKKAHHKEEESKAPKKCKPWVAFTSLNHRFSGPGLDGVMPVVSDLGRLAVETLVMKDQLRDLPMFRTVDRGCYSMKVAHGDEDKVYQALHPAATAAHALKPLRHGEEEDRQCYLGFPVVVTDSPLVECWYEDAKWLPQDQKGIQLGQSRFILMHWHGAKFTDQHVPVDVVTVDGLDHYAKVMYDGCVDFVQRLAKNLPSLVDAMLNNGFLGAPPMGRR